MAIHQAYRGNTVYIFGGSSGIGLACAMELYRYASTIVLFSRHIERGKHATKVVSNLMAEEGAQVVSRKVDIKNYGDLAKTLDETVRIYGAPDLLIQSAGIVEPSYFESTDRDALQEMINTNVIGSWNILQRLLPQMAAGSRAVIISSFAALLGIIGYSGYSTTKYALYGLAESLRNEYCHKGIAVQLACPSDTDTPQLAYDRLHKPPETAQITGNVKPFSARYVAKCILHKRAARRFLIVPGMYPKLIWLMKRVAPSMVYAIIDSAVRRAQDGRSNRVD